MTDEKSGAKAPKKKTAVKAAAPKAAQPQQELKRALPTRGRTFTGVVLSDKMAKTVTVEWNRRLYVPKYERYLPRKSRVHAHDDLGAKVGDVVKVKETRPISKTKSFVVVEIVR